MKDKRIYCNGINSVTGSDLISPIEVDELARIILGAPREDGSVERWLNNIHDERNPKSRHLALIEGVAVDDLSQAGWGVIFANDANPLIREALAPLIEMRREQAGGPWPEGRFREFSGKNGHRVGESAHSFLARHGVGPGSVDPARGIPYYVLLVGEPERIPYRFQYLLDVQFAVGRIYFDDLEGYQYYARSVVAAESGRWSTVGTQGDAIIGGRGGRADNGAGVVFVGGARVRMGDEERTGVVAADGELREHSESGEADGGMEGPARGMSEIVAGVGGDGNEEEIGQESGAAEVGIGMFRGSDETNDSRIGQVAEEIGESVGEVLSGDTTMRRLSLPRRCVFFGVENEGDRATHMTASALTKPLAAWLAGKPNTQGSPMASRVEGSPAPSGWQVDCIFGKEATRGRLLDVFTSEPPALLFTSSHGVGFPVSDPNQARHQGALLCSDWSRKGQGDKPPDRAMYVAGEDIPDDARLHGMIAFVLACYGAGTPRDDNFSFARSGIQRQIAERSFVSYLPQRLLSHPKGGALAVIGHVEKAWTHSFVWNGNQPQRTVFEDLVRRLSVGQPVGAAMEPMNGRFTELAALLINMYEDAKFGVTPTSQAIAGMWTAHNDARNYIVIGDPAVRLAQIE